MKNYKLFKEEATVNRLETRGGGGMGGDGGGNEGGGGGNK